MYLTYAHNHFKLSVNALNFKEKEQILIKEAAYKMVLALGDESFKIFCLNYTYTTKHCYYQNGSKICYLKYFHRFYNTDKKNSQVYEHLMTGQESNPKLSEVDQEADIFLKIDRNNGGNVIGYTYPSSKWQYIYKWVLDKRDSTYIAGNLAHEWCHKMGYSHKKNKGPHRKHTVTYAVGNFVRRFHTEKSKMFHMEQ